VIIKTKQKIPPDGGIFLSGIYKQHLLPFLHKKTGIMPALLLCSLSLD